MSTPYPQGFAPGLMPPPAPMPPRRSRPWGLIIGAFVVVALGIIVAVIVTLATAPSGGTNSAKPADAATAFLKAVADGDSAKALSLQNHQPAERSHLTDEALKASMKAAPITDIAVVRESESQVEVTYKAGGTPLHAIFTPAKQSDGSWRVERGTTTVRVTPRKGLPLKVDDIAVDRPEIEVFPGIHPVASGLANITYAETTLTAADAQSFPHLVPAPRVSEEGKKAFAAATRTALEACVRAKALAPADCPQETKPAAGQRPDEKTVVWRLENDPITGLDPKISATQFTAAEATISPKMTVRVTVEQGSMKGEVSGVSDGAATAYADLTANPVVVKFRR